MSHTVTVELHDLDTNLLVDISTLCLERSLTRQLNQARSFTFSARAGESAFTTIAGDGFPNLRKGNRKLLVWEDGTIIFHGRVFSIERTGDGKDNLVAVTAYDPFMELGFDSDDRAGRPVRDATGNFIQPSFGSPISGPMLIYQILVNSMQTGAESDPNPGEGPLPITLTGVFETYATTGIDLSPDDLMDWPVLCGDFIQQLVQTGVCDFDLRPVDPAEGFGGYVMVEMSAKASWGTDRSGTVHFDYFTGAHNASACRHLEDFATINNKLYDYLGPRKDKSHWKGNITPGSPGTTVDPSASRSRYGGEFMSIREFDSIGDENSARPLYLAAWNAEQGYRVEPRNLLYITAAPDSAALYEPPHDFDVGDRIAINTGGDFGLSLAEAQRVYGYTRSWDRQGVARVSELLTSADI